MSPPLTFKTCYVLYFRLLREKPNCSMVAMESIILFKRNKTAKWLKTKSREEKEKLFKNCIKIGRQQRQIDEQRQDGIQVHRQQVLKNRELTLVAKRKRVKSISVTKYLSKVFGILRWRSLLVSMVKVKQIERIAWRCRYDSGSRCSNNPPLTNLSIAYRKIEGNYHPLRCQQIYSS